MLFFKGKKLIEIDAKLDNLTNLINFQVESIKAISIQLNDLKTKQKLLEDICKYIIDNNNSKLLKLEILENKTDKNSENIINIEKIINKFKLETLKFISNTEENIIASIKQEILSNSEINEKIGVDICDKIVSSTKDIIDIKDTISNSKIEVIKFLRDTEKNVITSVNQEILSIAEKNIKIKKEVCDKIISLDKNISSEINMIDENIRLLLLNSVMEQL